MASLFPLPEIAFPLVIDTLGLCLATGTDISMHCQDCGKSRRLNLVRLAKYLGPDHGTMAADLRPHVWCVECGARGEAIGFIVQAPTDPHSMVPAR